MNFDIFCHVVDNYGDIGICWRLARQLHAEHGVAVRLWIDDLPALQRLCPEADPSRDAQRVSGIDIRRWNTDFAPVRPADVVIEAFGCPLPENYLQAMAARPRAPVWINLEYLSAEPWIDGCHALPSPHPRLPLTKHFFFPGFSAASGGLLREQDLIERRTQLQQDPAALWQRLGISPPEPEQTTVSLFCYDNAPVTGLLSAWHQAGTPLRCLMPAGRGLAEVAAWFDHSLPPPGERFARDRLQLEVLPFLRQEDYDLLLWACDCNFVRGEDSFVRAQWAGRPLVWQAYVQQEQTHQLKLAAFLDRYCAALE
ncbi:MAG: elongation factor P maturation arginine rhamnosyltransferase EarP, partial [Methylobacterium sp.]|nr:elongation factor P maturation arginine rhamnosyltransferase EarP [Methylobacterium sp.]